MNIINLCIKKSHKTFFFVEYVKDQNNFEKENLKRNSLRFSKKNNIIINKEIKHLENC